MKKIYNYLSYCVYSFIPLYVLLLIYLFIKQDVDMIVLLIILLIYGVLNIGGVSCAPPTNIFVCSPKEITKVQKIDYTYLILSIILTFVIIHENMAVYYKLLILLIVFIFLNKLSFVFKSYTLLILGYKVYNIRDKYIYSKKNYLELSKFLKERKSLQIIEISDNIYIEQEKYNLTKFYCEDYN